MSGTSLDLDALFTLGQGLYIVASHEDGRFNGRISNASMQVTAAPGRWHDEARRWTKTLSRNRSRHITPKLRRPPESPAYFRLAA